QVFHDRNVKGITVDKNLAMSMDQRDLGKQLAYKIADRVKIPTADGIVSLASLVQSQRRQLAASDDKLITLSGLRARWSDQPREDVPPRPGAFVPLRPAAPAVGAAVPQAWDGRDRFPCDVPSAGLTVRLRLPADMVEEG
ncbi:hypothetical protein ABTX87_53995, partial [Streptomyces sp. NPDC097610]